MSSSSSVRGIAHTGITVSDVPASIQLWQEVFGFELLGRAELDDSFLGDLIGVPGAQLTAAVLMKGAQTIELLQYRAPDQRQEYRPRPVDLGSVHVALDVEHIDAVVQAGQAHGLVLVGAVVMGQGVMAGTTMAYLHTLDGVMIELLQRPQ